MAASAARNPVRLKLGACSASLWLPSDVSNPAPLIMISHGAGGSLMDHRGTASLLASADFIVCAVEHEGDNWRDKRLLGTSAYWHARPSQFSDALEALLKHDQFSNLIDSSRIGALGFSAGGYTVLAAAGGQPDIDAIAAHMAKPERDPRFCGYAKRDGGSSATSAATEALWSSNRLKAILVVAPVGVPFGPNSLADVKAKIRIYRAGADQILAHPFHAEAIHGHLPHSHEYLVVEGLHHFGFIEPFPWYLRALGFEAAKDPKGFDRRAFLNGINPEVREFFHDEL